MAGAHSTQNATRTPQPVKIPHGQVRPVLWLLLVGDCRADVLYGEAG
jgi:hypothetical protein